MVILVEGPEGTMRFHVEPEDMQDNVVRDMGNGHRLVPSFSKAGKGEFAYFDLGFQPFKAASQGDLYGKGISQFRFLQRRSSGLLQRANSSTYDKGVLASGQVLPLDSRHNLHCDRAASDNGRRNYYWASLGLRSHKQNNSSGRDGST